MPEKYCIYKVSDMWDKDYKEWYGLIDDLYEYANGYVKKEFDDFTSMENWYNNNGIKIECVYELFV